MRNPIIALLAAALMASFIMIAGHHQSRSNEGAADRSAPELGNRYGLQRDSCCIAPGTEGGISGNSIYHVNSQWTDQNGERMKLSGLEGKVRVIAMFYSHCTYACPLTINDMKRISRALPSGLRDRVGFVLVSFDPERDSPAALRKLAESEEIDSTDWLLLTGSEGDDRTLAAELGVEFEKKADGDFQHSSLIAVLDESGDIIYRHTGLNKPIGDVVNAIKKAERARRRG